MSVASRVVTVKGPRGELKKEFKHVQLEVEVGTNEEGATVVKAKMWHAKSKQRSSLRTVLSHIDNMITGVTKGFRYKMRFVYAHFPINVALTNKDKRVEIRNFLGEKVTPPPAAAARRTPHPLCDSHARRRGEGQRTIQGSRSS